MRNIGIEIRRSSIHGRGVFALKEFNKGDLIENCPVIPISYENKYLIRKTELFDYYFKWGDAYKSAAIVLGYGSIYNHSYSPNAKLVYCHDKNGMLFVCVKGIKAGEEITHNYNGKVDSKKKLWFKVKT